VLATRFGLAAIDAVHDGAWGMMVALRSTSIELVALSDAVAKLRTVSVEEYERYVLTSWNERALLAPDVSGVLVRGAAGSAATGMASGSP
jgi:6-phosphofructokinase